LHPGGPVGAAREDGCIHQLIDSERTLLDLDALSFRSEGGRLALVRERTELTEVQALLTLRDLIGTGRALE
jgi:hypothetical protein